MKLNAKTITLIGMLCAIALAVVAFVRIPVVVFLEYEPKDVIITIGGFMLGPIASFMISGVVALIEMVTISDTGVIGAVMNMVSSCAFCCTAALIYKIKHSMKGAIAGLVTAVLVMTGVMLLWNYFLTPIYMGYPRETVAAMLPTVFLPFNLLKGVLNTGIVLLIYKPVVGALRRARLIQGSVASYGGKRRLNTGILLAAVLLIATGVLAILAFNGII